MSFEQLDEDDRGYIAGFLDGEGCFTVVKRWKIVVACENTYRPTIERLHKIFGGCFTPMVRKRKKNWRPTYRWAVVSNDALQVCQSVAVYLKEKQPQAVMLIALQQTMGMPRVNGRLDPEVVEFRNEVSEKVRALKHVTS